MTRPEWIEVGRVSRPHGVRGEVRIIVESDNPERFAEGMVLHARPARTRMVGGGTSLRTPLTILETRGDTRHPIVAFAEVRDRETASDLRGSVLEVRSEELPALSSDEFYSFDIEGLAVRDPQGTAVGTVKEVIDNPAHPVLAVSLESGDEVLVPFVLSAVPEVAMKQGYVVVRPEFLESP